MDNPIELKTPAKATAASDAPHHLELEYGRAVSLTGVKDVPVFTDKNVTVRLTNQTLLIQGDGLAVKALDLEKGKLNLTGRVKSLRYTSDGTPSSLIKRIFK